MTDLLLRDRILDDIKIAMRDKAKEELLTLRMLTAAIKQREVDERITLDNQQVILLVEKLIKQRKEAINQYEAGNRQDLADKEAVEITILQKYLPLQLTEHEVNSLIEDSIAKAQAYSIKDMGKVMALVKDSVQGRADMGEVSRKIKEILSNS